jgi:hypothetical protein
MLEHFLKNEKNPEAFRVLKYRIKENYPTIENDFTLLKKSYEKINQKLVLTGEIKNQES